MFLSFFLKSFCFFMLPEKQIKFQLAPLQGITNSVFRKVYARHFIGIDKFFTPFFTNVHKKELNPAKAAELTAVKINNITLVPQILSKDSAEILRFANYVKILGFKEINWNLGCPFPRVAKKKRGSGLLPFPDDIRKILDVVMPELPVKLSVKARLGYENSNEILSLIPVFNDYNLKELTVHARIGKQLYKGNVMLDNFNKILELSKIPVGYNGDIFSLADFLYIKKRLPGIEIFMLGRGLLVDPFLPEILFSNNNLINKDAPALIKKFVDDLYFETRKKHNDRLSALNVLKEYWWYLSYSFENPSKVFGMIKKKKSFDDYEDAVNEVFKSYLWLGSSARLFKHRSEI